MRRYRLLIEYDGTEYAGWQRQENALAVQQVAERAWERITGEKTSVIGASRTDAGVHALWQVAHVDSETRIPAEKLCFALNASLPPDVRVWRSEEAEAGFHACRNALRKRYDYTWALGPFAPAIGYRQAWHMPYALDEAAMESALASLIGLHDFAAFAASGHSAKTTVREIFSAALAREGRYLRLSVEGSGFLYNMVRIIAGTLTDIGKGKLAAEAFAQALRSLDREDLGQTAPPQGLCLMRIDYEASNIFAHRRKANEKQSQNDQKPPRAL